MTTALHPVTMAQLVLSLAILLFTICLADSSVATKSLSPTGANVQPRMHKFDEFLVKFQCLPRLPGQAVAFRVDYRQASDCTASVAAAASSAPIGLNGHRLQKFESLSMADIAAANWWLFNQDDLSHQQQQQSGAERGLPLVTARMLTNCSGLAAGPLKSVAGIGDYVLMIDASGCPLAGVLAMAPRLIGNTGGRCLLYGIQGTISLSGLESGPAASMCVLMQEHGYSNRRSFLNELRLGNRSCYVAATATQGNGDSFINRVSVVFVSVSFVLLVAISVSWIVFYYVQRFRYRHAKKRLTQRLCNAAKTALAKIPVRHLQTADDAELQWIGDHCAVCIEPYGCGDPVRILPCKHKYHTHCIDQWLLDQRSCPLCKTDILKACGLWVSGGSRISLDDVTNTPANSQQHQPVAAANAAPAAAVASAVNEAAPSNRRQQLPTMQVAVKNGPAERSCLLHHSSAEDADPPASDPLLGRPTV